ncbi:hypothetical protein JTE90_005419 [Oedothorax gibbosus]|uniref:Uncharacterized protein n=1 Tax=Oedothorax gibbosus TaxID=931172 RepID=A0AAV6UP85_9ARAC|nr:hypothetical protein JTE90_005419 [Oedothorax gibbosus]
MKPSSNGAAHQPEHPPSLDIPSPSSLTTNSSDDRAQSESRKGTRSDDDYLVIQRDDDRLQLTQGVVG